MIRQKLNQYISTLLDLRPGELRRVLLLMLNIFLIIATLMIIKPTINGLFVSRFGAEGLPLAYILVAVFAVVITSIYSRLMSRSSLLSMIIGSFGVNVFVLLLFGLLMQQETLPGWMLYLVYIWVAVFGVFSASQFWIMANIMFNVREAKRLFGLIGSGAILGAIAGGYLTKIFAPILGSASMLFVGAGLLMICVPITLYLWRRYIKTHHHQAAVKQHRTTHIVHPLTHIRRSPLLIYLSLIIGVSVIVAKLADYQFSDIAARKITDTDQLTAFFGFWFSNFALVSLFFQLFITRRILAKFGIGGALMSLPLGLLGGAIALMFFPELWAALLIKSADSSLKQSVNKAGVELLGIPIALEIKKQTKAFIDVVVDSLATGIGGLILVFLVVGLNLSTTAISIMIILLVAVWIYFILKVRRDYLDSLRHQLVNDKLQHKSPDLRKYTGRRILQRVLTEGTESEILWALNQVRLLRLQRLVTPVIQLLNSDSEEILESTIRTVNVFHQQTFDSLIRPFIHHKNTDVQIAAYEYLIAHGKQDLAEIRNLIYKGELDYRVRGRIMVELAHESSHNPTMRRMLGVEKYILKNADKISLTRDPIERKYWKLILAEGIGKAKISSTYHFLHKLCKDSDPVIANRAFRAAGETKDPQFVSLLIEALKTPEYRPTAISALVSYGPTIIEDLRQRIETRELDSAAIRIATKVVKQIQSTEAVQFLFRLSEHENQGVQIDALRALTEVKQRFPHLKFDNSVIVNRIFDEVQLYIETLSSLYAQTKSREHAGESEYDRNVREAREGLINLLHHRLENHFEQVFRLLGLRYAPDDFTLFLNWKANMANKQESVTNAIEFLDTLLHPNLKKVVIPIVESRMIESVTQDLLDKFDVEVPEEHESLDMLLGLKDTRIRLAIFYLIEQMNDRKYLSFLKPFLNDQNEKVQDYANRVYQHLTENLSEN